MWCSTGDGTHPGPPAEGEPLGTRRADCDGGAGSKHSESSTNLKGGASGHAPREPRWAVPVRRVCPRDPGSAGLGARVQVREGNNASRFARKHRGVHRDSREQLRERPNMGKCQVCQEVIKQSVLSGQITNAVMGITLGGG